MGGGTEAFPDLGRHCEHDSCRQLDFLPFECEGCHKVFCLEHRTYVDHNCPKAEHKSRVVVVCEACSVAIEKKTDQTDEEILEHHLQSGKCDPKKKQKPKCPVKRCKEVLTFSNTSTCKTCKQKVCLKHRFPAEHACATASKPESRLLLALASRSGNKCRGNNNRVPSSQSVKAC